MTGTEIKSLRERNATITDAYVYVKDGQAFIANMHIAAYKEGNIFNVDHLRDRKLLLTKTEIKRLSAKISATGYTCVPTKVFLSHGFAKIEVAVAKGKELHDKRASIKEKELNRKLTEIRHSGGEED